MYYIYENDVLVVLLSCGRDNDCTLSVIVVY